MKAERRVRFARPRIGWREWASFPDLGVEEIKAKIDTGAKTSAIHAFDIEVLKRGGERMVAFSVSPEQRRRRPEVRCLATLVGPRLIRCSNGAMEERYVVATRLKLGERDFVIELSLAARDEMGFRLLLGRDALRKRFLIDPGASFLLGKRGGRR
ncbi:MAG: RimK/LysX family protein [Parvularculaceae bacterium]|nr:RimK/LysX family protein [Parvularculaceae bacterium]